MLSHVRGYAKKHRVHTPLAQFPSRSYTVATPYGNTLIMSPWNYPFLLTMEPLVDAIAAGITDTFLTSGNLAEIKAWQSNLALPFKRFEYSLSVILCFGNQHAASIAVEC